MSSNLSLMKESDTMKQFTLHDVVRCIFAKYICDDTIAVNFIDVSAFARFIIDEIEHNEIYTIDINDLETYLRICKY